MSWGLRTAVMMEQQHFVTHAPTLGCHSEHESHQTTEAKHFAVKTKRLKKHKSPLLSTLVDHYNSNAKINTVLPKLSCGLDQTVDSTRRRD